MPAPIQLPDEFARFSYAQGPPAIPTDGTAPVLVVRNAVVFPFGLSLIHVSSASSRQLLKDVGEERVATICVLAAAREARSSRAEMRRLEASVEWNPKARDIVRLAQAYLAAGRLMEAATVCQRVIKQHPDLSDGHLVYSRVLAAKGQMKEAEDFYAVGMALARHQVWPLGVFWRTDKSLLPSRAQAPNPKEVARVGCLARVLGVSPEAGDIFGALLETGMRVKATRLSASELRLTAALAPLAEEPCLAADSSDDIERLQRSALQALREELADATLAAAVVERTSDLAVLAGFCAPLLTWEVRQQQRLLELPAKRRLDEILAHLRSRELLARDYQEKRRGPARG